MSALSLAIGRTPRSAALLDAPPEGVAVVAVQPVSRAFAPMLREGRYDLSEMAIASFLMARAAGLPVVLLPCVLAARAQEGSLLCRADSPLRGPGDLRGARIGVRAYSQTTGMWLRGVLAEGYGLAPAAMRWITFEEAHVAGFRDPPFCTRAPEGASLEAMLREGALDAAIFGSDAPADAALRCVFPDPAAEAAAFRAAHGFTPVNHLLIARREVAAARAEEIARLLAALAASGAEVTTRAALAPALALASAWCAAQGLIPRPLGLEEIWAGTPERFA
ncbi:ABC transporter substrate-binding protein [Rubritepida flocculans]|uniref:ABC transporter substrate-binding protein n=1 Tax=Rubritepida flocculans TaxID=182403 RepID=UPI00041FC58A|nr:ABC transporter substrate-binding protein [Rubritepida flocculans]